ncbi:MAG: AEC family transporter [Lysobacterales bacterium]|nr:MAG: AEC family transporter [Xanthomonadales bacterium]
MIELLLRIGGIVFPVFAIAAVGALWGRRHRPDMSVVNRLNVEVFAPALVFWALADKPLDFDLYRDLAIGGIAVVLGSGLLLWPFVRLAGIDARTFIPPMMFNNSGNMGIPLALFAFGETALQAAVVLFIIEMVLHFTVGLYILDHRTRPWRLLKMPMIQATIAGLACSAFGLTLPAPLANTIKLMGQVSIPLLLFALGVRLLDVNLRDWKLGTAGAFAGPLAGVVSLWLVLPWLALDEAQFPQLLIFAALPPAVLNVLVAEQYRQEPERVASIVLIGNLGSLVVLPAALWFALPH